MAQLLHSVLLALFLAAATAVPSLSADAGISDDESAALMVSDDACELVVGNGDCGLELRQLRARETQSTVGLHGLVGSKDVVVAVGEGAPPPLPQLELSEGVALVSDSDVAKAQGAEEAVGEEAAYGPDAVGKNMWQETTWDDVLVEIVSDATWHASSCNVDTNGTCGLFSCSASRGNTRCVGGKCQCQHGYCAKGGACYPDSSQCIEDTGGTCAITRCRKSRGNTKCKSGMCLCKTGGCAHKGKCFPVTDTGGSCNLLPCGMSRGPTSCHRGRCLCQAGYVAVRGRCEPF